MVRLGKPRNPAQSTYRDKWRKARKYTDGGKAARRLLQRELFQLNYCVWCTPEHDIPDVDEQLFFIIGLAVDRLASRCAISTASFSLTSTSMVVKRREGFLHMPMRCSEWAVVPERMLRRLNRLRRVGADVVR